MVAALFLVLLPIGNAVINAVRLKNAIGRTADFAQGMREIGFS